MDTNAFVEWALSGERTLEERITTELVVERGVDLWNAQRKIYRSRTIDQMMERKRQRALNPAYEPRLSEESVRRTAEVLDRFKHWMEFNSHDDRPIRDISVLGFLTALENVGLHHCEVVDVSPLTRLPQLRTLHFSSTECRDLRPLAGCRALRDLQLKLLRHWPEVAGLETLPEVESLLLEGNLLVFERAVWPRVKFAVLRCSPLEARNVRHLPQLPACEFLSLGGVESLEGIEGFAALRNLTIESCPESFEPLTGLKHLTSFTSKEHEPLDVEPLTRVPGLQFVCFNTWNKTRLRPVKPRDLAPLVEAPALRELQVLGNPLLETEAAAIQAGLPGWSECCLLPEPRPVRPWRLIAWPAANIPQGPEVNRLPEEPEQVDLKLRERELRWAQEFMRRAITRKLGTSDWSEQEKRSFENSQDYHPHIVSPTHRTLQVEFNSYGLLEKIPLVVEAMQETLAQLRGEYRVYFLVNLKVPKRKRSAAQKKLEEKLQREREEEEFERERQEREEYLERLHRYELLKQEGRKIDPKDFAPDGSTDLETPEIEPEEDEDDNGDANAEVAVKKKPDPDPVLDDGEHPLAHEYYFSATFTLGECYVFSGRRSLAEYLFQRPCDEVIEEDKQP